MSEELRCSLCSTPTRLGCSCARVLLGSHMERDQAVEKLGRQLERTQPVTEAFDFWSLVPSEDELPDVNPAVERARITQRRETRLVESGIDKAITDEDFERLAKAWRKVGPKGRERIVPAVGKPNEPGEVMFEHDTAALRNVCGWENARSSGTSAFSVLTLLGMRGVGKTVGIGWLIAGRGGLYTTAELLRSAFVATHHKERELYMRALKVGVLFVDELGREKDAETADAMLFDLVNNRRGSGRGGQFWTAFAGNLSDKDFRDRYDPSTVDRIEQLGVIFTCGGENLRGRLIDDLRKQKAKREGA